MTDPLPESLAWALLFGGICLLGLVAGLLVGLHKLATGKFWRAHNRKALESYGQRWQTIK